MVALCRSFFSLVNLIGLFGCKRFSAGWRGFYLSSLPFHEQQLQFNVRAQTRFIYGRLVGNANALSGRILAFYAHN
ncbi:hypothetical protein ACTXT7_008841 [Hymenolepis weldensis]